MGRITRLLTLALALLPAAAFAADTVDIYWIDVEGGASTLIVTQAGQSVLMDAGYAGFNDRDAKRIEHVVKKEAGLDHIDYFLTSHFHGDHAGGLAPLAKRVKIDRFIDHGDSVDKDSGGGKELWESYLAVAGGKRHVAEPGERLELQGVELTIVAAHSRFLPSALPGGGPNPLCKTFDVRPEDRGENGKSLGYLLRAGDFEFVNLGDLSWNFQYQMACPVNLLGKVDLYQVTHHGGNDVLPQQMWALDPTVAVMNNGPTKGGAPEGVETALNSPALDDLWQLHRAIKNDADHNTDERLTANLDESPEDCDGHWIHARVDADGTYTLTNSRNGFSKTYKIK
jgi:beta-lactamase superfamily II metal-dependent hydrolase